MVSVFKIIFQHLVSSRILEVVVNLTHDESFFKGKTDEDIHTDYISKYCIAFSRFHAIHRCCSDTLKMP